MKTLSIFTAVLFSLFTLHTNAQKTALTKETIKVWGNCGMCKTTIEKAAKKAGAAVANWSEETHELQVSYAAAKTTSKKIQQSIANAGYDTQDVTADNGAYKKLHGCCQYDRKAAATDVQAANCCSDDKCTKAADTCKEKACCKEKTCCKS